METSLETLSKQEITPQIQKMLDEEHEDGYHIGHWDGVEEGIMRGEESLLGHMLKALTLQRSDACPRCAFPLTSRPDSCPICKIGTMIVEQLR